MAAGTVYVRATDGVNWTEYLHVRSKIVSLKVRYSHMDNAIRVNERMWSFEVRLHIGKRARRLKHTFNNHTTSKCAEPKLCRPHPTVDDSAYKDDL